MGELVTWVRAQRDRTAGFTLVALGAVLLLSGWVGVSGTSDRAGQLSYLVSGGLGGLFCLAAGASLLLLADLDDERRKLDELSGVLQWHDDPTDGCPPKGRRGLLLAVTVAAMVLASAWLWASGASDQSGAIPGLLVALVAVGGAGLVEGAALWRARRSFARRKIRLIDEVSSRWPDVELQVEQPGPAPADSTVLTVDGLRRYHRPGCPTMAGVSAAPVARDRVSPDLLPCQLCEAP
ncbi:MAG: hypothetical protein ACRDYV_20800 [Acidimicrobiia bacterium]